MQNVVHRSNTRIQRPAVGWSQLCAHSSLPCRLAYGVWRSGCGPTWPNGAAVACGVVLCPLWLGYGSLGGGGVRVSWHCLDGVGTHSWGWCGWVWGWGWGG